MLVCTATIDGDKATVKFFGELSERAPEAIARGLRNAARGVFDEAMKNLSGPGRTPVKTHGNWKWRATGYQREGATKLRGQHSFLGARPGSYPVPVLTENLRGRLGILEPGESKKGETGTFTAGKDEFVVYDIASYAHVIRDGTFSSKNHGPRDFTGDALETYDNTVGIATQIEQELQEELDR